MDLITLSIPAFFLLMGVELLVSRLSGRRLYRLNDAIADLSLGILQQVVGIFSTGALALAYVWLWREHRLLDVSSSSPLAWIAILVGVDFCYYWFHRASHRVNLAWATHAPHHSSEDYNLAVALRQGPLQPFASTWFYLPLAWLGFPPEMFATTAAINTIYQFWIHTELVGKLGPLEWVLNTPSHHRVHHGCTGKYLDRNHAGMLIVWDRLFGTFQPEEEPPTYGTTKALASFSPIWASVAPVVEIARVGLRSERRLDLFKVWLMPPEWRPRGQEEPLPDVEGRPKYDARPSKAVSAYVFTHFFGTVALTVGLLFFGAEFERVWLVAGAVIVVVGLATAAGLHEQRRWALPAELARLAALATLGAAFAFGTAAFSVVAISASGVALASAAALLLGRSAAAPRRA